MAVTYTEITATRVTLDMQDALGNSASVAFDTNKAYDLLADAGGATPMITALVAALEADSNAKVCHITVQHNYEIAGNKTAATNAPFASKYDRAKLKFENSANCKEKSSFTYPAPIQASFSGADLILYADPTANALNQAVITAIVAMLRDKDGNGTFVYDKGSRVNEHLPVPNFS